MFSAKQLSKFPRGHTCPLVVVILALLFPLNAHADVVLGFDACPPGNLETYTEDGFLITWVGFGDPVLAFDAGDGDMVFRDSEPNNWLGVGFQIRSATGEPFVLKSFKANDFTGNPASSYEMHIDGYFDGDMVATDNFYPASTTFETFTPVNLDGVVVQMLNVGMMSFFGNDDWSVSEITLTGIDAGTVLVGNLDETIEGYVFPRYSPWCAAAFETDSHPYTLNSVTFKMTPSQFPSPDLAFARVHLADGSGMPGLLLGELTNPTMVRDVLGDYVFVSDTGIPLQRNTRYLVCVGSQTGSSAPDQRALWHYTNATTSEGPGTLVTGIYRSYDEGAAWTLAYPDYQALFQVDAQQEESILVRKEIPVTFQASSTMFTKSELVNAGQPDEMIVVSLPDGTKICRSTTDSSIVFAQDKDGRDRAPTAKELEELEKLGFDTGWIPGGSPLQIKITFNASEGNVDVAEAGILVLEYDESLVGPGMNVPVTLTWEADPGQGSVHSDGGLIFSAEYKVSICTGLPWPLDACWNFGGDLPGIPQVDLGWDANATFRPFLLDGASVVCQDDFEGVEFMMGPDIGVGSLTIGAQISGTATGVLSGETLCVNWGGTDCTLAAGESIVRSFTVSTVSASTDLSIPQTYDAQYIFGLSFDICPAGCVSVGICPVCASACISPWCLHTSPSVFNDMDISLNFNSPVAEVTIDGMMPEITGAEYAVTKAVGETVVITGKHFGVVEGEVRFGSIVAPITTWNHTMIQVTVPEGAESGLCVETVVGDSPIFDFDGPVSAPLPNPLVYDLLPNYPNPFNPSTNIRFEVPVRGEVSIRIFDPAGRLVRTLVRDREFIAGQHSVVWNGKDDSDRHVASGIYYFQMRSASFEATRQMTLVR